MRVLKKQKAQQDVVRQYSAYAHIYMNAHTHMRAHAYALRAHICLGFPFASKQWIFKTKRLIFPYMKKFLKNLQKLAKNALQKNLNGLLYASCRKQ